MTGREDRVTLLGYICMAVLINSYIAGTGATACTDRIIQDNFVHVIPMCESGTLRNTRVVIDSWDTEDPDVYNCTCTVTLDTGSIPSTYTTTLVVEEYPEMSPSKNCGSILTINDTKFDRHTETRCTRVPATPVYNFEISDMLTLTLSRADVTTPWTSGHCVLISQAQGSGSLELRVACKDPQGKVDRPTTTTTEAIPRTTESATTTTPIISTTTKSIRTSTSSGETTVNIDSNETTSPDTKSTPTTTRQCAPECHPQQGYPLSAVLVPLVVSILMLSVGTAANVILYKRRFALIKQPGNTDPNMTSPNMNNYDSLDLSRVEPPNMYADTTTGHMYVNTTTGS